MSTPERHARVKEIFLAACELAPEDRARALDEACASDEGLRREVEALLALDEKTTHTARSEPAPSTLIGSFPGAAPALIGWAAATGSIDLPPAPPARSAGVPRLAAR